jgi:lysozyme family protein
MMMIDRLLDELITREGGYCDHPADRGGPTNFGITQAVARSEGFAGAMRDLPRALAKEIYRRRYWTAPRFDRVDEIAPAIAAELFDTGVNMGPAVAVGILQRTLNAFNRRQSDWPDIAVDRRIGPATLNALRATCC